MLIISIVKFSISLYYFKTRIDFCYSLLNLFLFIYHKLTKALRVVSLENKCFKDTLTYGMFKEFLILSFYYSYICVKINIFQCSEITLLNGKLDISITTISFLF